MKEDTTINPTHEAADAFWKYWADNGETHKHGYYESTWGAINAAIKAAGLHAPSASPSTGGSLFGAKMHDKVEDHPFFDTEIERDLRKIADG